MTAHLLAITIGPVQEFIAAARRTRDLWFGSQLLSEISKAAAMNDVCDLVRQRVVDAASLVRLADELLVAWQFAAAFRQADCKPAEQKKGAAC